MTNAFFRFKIDKSVGQIQKHKIMLFVTMNNRPYYFAIFIHLSIVRVFQKLYPLRIIRNCLFQHVYNFFK